MKAEQVNIAFRDFVFTMGQSEDIPECPVIPGYGNRTVRPDTTEYVIYTPIMQPTISRKGHFWLVDSANMAAAGRWVVGNIQQVTYQVDAWGKTAHARMSRLKNLFEDAIGYEFFREKYADFYGGIGIVGASEIRNMTTQAGTSDYEHRYSADFRITATIEDVFEYQGIDAVEFELIKVD